MIEKVCGQCGMTKSLDDFYKQEKVDKNKNKYTYYNPKCKDCVKENYDNWRLENPERHNKNNKKYNDSRVGKQVKRKLNQKYTQEGKIKTWRQNNRDKLKEYAKNHRIHDISSKEWVNCKAYFDDSCAYCGISENEAKQLYGHNLHKEHVTHDGENDLTNCIPACRNCNSDKHQFSLEYWYYEGNPIYSKERLDRIIKWLNEDCLIDLKEVIT